MSGEKIIVECYNYETDGKFDLVKIVQLPKIMTTPTQPQIRLQHLMKVSPKPINSNNYRQLEDLNRKLKILKKIKEDGELKRLRVLIEKWRGVGIEALEKMKEFVESAQVERLSERGLAQFMGVNDPKLLALLFPCNEMTSSEDEDSEKNIEDDGKGKKEFQFYDSSQ